MRSCPSCGFENADSAKFCPECGTALAVAARALREERKVVTVVFADLVGSTARAERLDPEDVRAILTPYHERLRHELERFGGTVEKFIGDAVVGVFGAPVVARGRRGACGSGGALDSGCDRGVERGRSEPRARGPDRSQHGRGARRARGATRARRGDGRRRRDEHRREAAGGGSSRRRSRQRSHAAR